LHSQTDSGTVLPDVEDDEGPDMSTFVRWLRLGTGLILATYIVLHLLNLALGLLSIEAMEGFRKTVTEIWYHPLGGPLLYLSFLVHFLLALWSLYRRSNLRLKPWEAMQLTLGLLILPLAASHMIGIRLRAELYHVEVTYPQVVAKYWLHPWTGWKQVLLVGVIWLHMAIGLHYWLRLKPWYTKAVPVLYLAAALLPVLALLGLARTGLTIEPELASPEWVARLFAPFKPEHEAVLHAVERWALVVMGGMLLATLAAREIRRAIRNHYGSYHMSLDSGRRLKAPVGVTVLEAIRAAGIPHASVCGGRGRCTTCRVRVNAGLDALPLPNDTERRALDRIAAPRNVRLACQTRPRRDLSVMPLLPPSVSAQVARRLGTVQGHERTVTVMFLDLRGSTSLGERLLPYDAVFVLNRFFAEMSAALKETNGHYAQFNGDGLMALYGLERGVEAGCCDALAGASAMFRRLAVLNESLEAEMGQVLRMGIGIHTGEAIVGTMGPPDAPTLTAVGDTVNVAARLESETKTLGCRVVVSETTAAASGLDFSLFPRHTAMLRGRSEPLPVYAVDEVDTLAMQPA
jgi:adenylate cyclase